MPSSGDWVELPAQSREDLVRDPGRPLPGRHSSYKTHRYSQLGEGPVTLPDFLVIGAPKAGTTALHAALARHPGLYLSAVKEPKFFLTDGPPPARGGPGDAQTYREHIWRRADYEALFSAAPAGGLCGEATPFYPYAPAPPRR